MKLYSQFAIRIVLGWIGRRAAPGSFFEQFPEFEYQLPTAKKVLPLSVVFVGMITFNNLCLKYVEVSFYNVARSLTICFNVVFTFVVLGDKTSAKTMATLAVVVLGFVLGSGSEVNFSLMGTVFGVMSSVFVSLNSIFTKGVMSAVDGDKWKLSAYNNMNAVIMFIPLILATGEYEIINQHADLLFSGFFWTMMTLSGVFGFGIGIATILQIKVTSPLTHNISGTAKACVQTILALMLWGNETNAANLFGTFLVLAGSLLYSYVRTLEMNEASSKAMAPPLPKREEQESLVQADGYSDEEQA